MGTALNPKNRRRSTFNRNRDMSIIVACAILVRDDFRCAYCHTKLDMRTVQLDHILGRKAGGQAVATNLVACCGPCNRKKQTGIDHYRPIFRAIELAQRPVDLAAGRVLAMKHYPSRVKPLKRDTMSEVRA